MAWISLLREPSPLSPLAVATQVQLIFVAGVSKSIASCRPDAADGSETAAGCLS
jgi:hypothetical protein